MPVPRPPASTTGRAVSCSAFGRVAPGVSVAQAQADVAAVSQRLRASYPDAFRREAKPHVQLSLLKEDLVRGARPLFLVLWRRSPSCS